MERVSGKGFSFDVQTTPLPGMSGAFIPDAIRADAQIRKDVLRVDIQQNDRVELFAYWIQHPSLDYWLRDNIFRNLKKYISDQDATLPAQWHELNVELNFAYAGANATYPQRTVALFETILRYYNAIHFLYAAVAQAMNWANMRGFPIATRAMDTLRVTTLTSILQSVNGFPVNRAACKYLMTQQRILEFIPEPGVMIHAYPLYLPESHMHPEAGSSPLVGQGYSTRGIVLPTIPELMSSDNAASLAGNGYYSAAGMIISYLYNRVINGQKYLLESLGFTDKVLKIGSKLSSFFSAIGIFDDVFNFDQIISDVNAQPLYDGWDFVDQMMRFADRPRPILKHNKGHVYYNTADAHPESAIIFDDPWAFIFSDQATPRTPTALGIANDRYEYLNIPTNAAAFRSVINTMDWTAATGIVCSLPITNEQLTIGALPDRILRTWWGKPYMDFYVPHPDAIDPGVETIGEKGITFLVNEEYQSGFLMPRYAILPSIDNMDPFMCGFMKVVSHETRFADPWSVFITGWNVAGTTWDPNVWGEHSGQLWDALLWVGSAINLPPERAFNDPLASQVSWHAKGGADARRIGAGEDDTADQTMAAFPFTPFLYQYRSPTPNMLAGSAANTWDPTNQQWADASAASQQAYDHTITRSNRATEEMWFALEYWDPTRPYRVRYANYINAMKQLYRDRVDLVVENISALYSNASIKTVPLTKENSRYLSKYRILGITKAPIVGTASSREPLEETQPQLRSANTDPEGRNKDVLARTVPTIGKSASSSGAERGSPGTSKDISSEPRATTDQKDQIVRLFTNLGQNGLKYGEMLLKMGPYAFINAIPSEMVAEAKRVLGITKTAKGKQGPRIGKPFREREGRQNPR
jgi:hypothetical protein